jgi:hypothetical protein
VNAIIVQGLHILRALLFTGTAFYLVAFLLSIDCNYKLLESSNVTFVSSHKI